MKTTKNTKTVKKNKNTVKKVEFTPKYVIDITMCSDIEEILSVIAMYKLAYDEEITDMQMVALINTTREAMLNVADLVLCENEVVVNSIYDNHHKIIRMKRYSVNDGEKLVVTNNDVKVKKPNVFKRFWNWITRKK